MDQDIVINLSSQFCVCLFNIIIYFHLVDLLLKGRVTINAKPGMKLEIPDGVVIENEVSQLYLFAYFVYVIVLTAKICLLCFPGH